MSIVSHRSVFCSCLLTLVVSACGGNQPPAPAAPPPPPPAAAPAPLPPAVAGAPAVAAPAAPAASAAPAPAADKHHGHMGGHLMASMLFMQLPELGLKPEQKTAIDAIEADLDKVGDSAKDQRAQLANDIAEGVTAGKLNKAKIDADVKMLAQAAGSAAPSIQDALTKLHKTLDAAQRKKLIELLQAKAKEHQEHAMGPMGGHGEPGKGPKGEHGEHGMGPKGEHGEHGMGPGEHPGHGPGPMGEHAEHGPMGGHGMDPQAALEKLSSDLGLTPEQREKLKTKLAANLKAAQADMKTHQAAMQKHLKTMGDAFTSDTFDAKKVGVGEHVGDMAKMMATGQIRFVEAVLSVLTPEQRAKFAEHVRQHAKASEEGEHH